MWYRYFQENISQRYCRGCINNRFHLRLERKDCFYYRYPGECEACHQVKHIVVGVVWKSRLKLLRGRR